MGLPFSSLHSKLQASFGAECNPTENIGLVVPFSSTALDGLSQRSSGLQLEKIWLYNMHLNLDDLDFATDGIWATLKRVIGRRGLVLWRVRRNCTVAETKVRQGVW